MEFTTDTYLLIILVILLHIGIIILVTKKPKKNIFGRHVLVTGGSSGIGLQVALCCALKGANVTVVARNVDLLKKSVDMLELHRQTEAQKFNFVSIDLTEGYDKVSDALRLSKIEETSGEIYMMVNCAGMAICGIYEDISVEDAKKMMDINYYATYYCTRYVLPKMKAARDGIIVLTGSQASLLGIYGYGPYAASKFALRGMAETLNMECKHLGISIILALPSDTNTPGFENEEKSKPEVTKIISGSGGLASPEDVGRKIVKDALSGTFFSILGFESWLITLLCCGVAPWGGVGLNMLQVVCMGPLRAIGIFLQWNFSRIVKNNSKEKTN